MFQVPTGIDQYQVGLLACRKILSKFDFASTTPETWNGYINPRKKDAHLSGVGVQGPSKDSH